MTRTNPAPDGFSGSVSKGAIKPRASLKKDCDGSGGVTASVSPVVVYMPFPPSNNGLYANRRGGRRRSDRYLSWSVVAHGMVKKQKIKRVKGKVNLWIYLADRDGRKKDADNFGKACIDLLVERGIIEDDNKDVVRSVHLIWSHETEGAMISINPAPLFREAA